MRRGRKKFARQDPQARINEAIRAREIRVLSEDGENIGILSRDEALRKAQEAELDLIEISPEAKPPVAKIMDYGQFKYEEKKKIKNARSKQSSTETKNIQIKIGTGENDLKMKAARADAYLEEGHRVKLELYLRGRSKFLEKDFLEERFDRFTKLITVGYKVSEEPKKSPKGIAMVLEKKAAQPQQ